MKVYSLPEAAAVCGVSVTALRRRADRGTLRVVLRDGRRLVPEAELRRTGLLPDAEVIALRDELARVRADLSAHRQLVASTDAAREAEAEARRRAEEASYEARALAQAAEEQLHALASASWRKRRRRLRELRRTTATGGSRGEAAMVS